MAGAAAAVLAGLIGLAAVTAVQTRSNRDLRAASEKTSQALRAEKLANEKTSRALEAETRAMREKEQALAQIRGGADRAEAVLGFLKQDVLAATRPERQAGGLGMEVTVRKAIDAAEPRIAGHSRISRSPRRRSATH